MVKPVQKADGFAARDEEGRVEQLGHLGEHEGEHRQAARASREARAGHARAQRVGRARGENVVRQRGREHEQTGQGKDGQ